MVSADFFIIAVVGGCLCLFNVEQDIAQVFFGHTDFIKGPFIARLPDLFQGSFYVILNVGALLIVREPCVVKLLKKLFLADLAGSHPHVSVLLVQPVQEKPPGGPGRVLETATGLQSV